LHYAASSGDADVAEALIDGGANIEVPDGSIGTPLDAACGHSTQQENVITWLRGLGARSASSD
jgi:ankyrin repeat protein